MCTITQKLQVQVFTSDLDGVPVVQIDTENNTGRMRVNINDAAIWDGDPELDEPHPLLDGYELLTDDSGNPLLACINCGSAINSARRRPTLSQYVTDAENHSCNLGG